MMTAMYCFTVKQYIVEFCVLHFVSCTGLHCAAMH